MICRTLGKQAWEKTVNILYKCKLLYSPVGFGPTIHPEPGRGQGQEGKDGWVPGREPRRAGQPCGRRRGAQGGRATQGTAPSRELVPSSSACSLAMASVSAPFRTCGEAAVPARPETEQCFLSGLLSGERPPRLPHSTIAAILFYQDTPNRQIIASTRRALDDPSELITADLYFVFQGAEQTFQGWTANGSCSSSPPATEGKHG